MRRAYVKKKLKEITAATMAILGICAAGSEGPYFPWANLVGLLVVFVVGGIALEGARIKKWKLPCNMNCEIHPSRPWPRR